MKLSLPTLLIAVATILLAAQVTLAAGCNVIADEGSPALETTAVMLEAAVFPTPRDLASVGEPGWSSLCSRGGIDRCPW